MIEGMVVGNLLLLLFIVFSGLIYIKVVFLVDIFKLKFFSERIFYSI